MTILLAPSENHIWEKKTKQKILVTTDREINEKYDSREQRIVTESNREKLPNFVEALKRPNYMILRPFYQRRPRWNPERQSKLIESFIINIPVPPIFLYEQGYNSYEVMDGQQRITAIQAFYNNELTLTGLELWPELNGKTYLKLPSKIRTGIDRRSISSVVLVKESAESEEEAQLIKQLVFERLNTGGVQLSNQEVRNCLYQGRLNSLLLKLSRLKPFAQAWGIPDEIIVDGDKLPDNLLENKLFASMNDAELVLRFFALRHVEQFSNGMQGFLNIYMIRSRDFTDEDIAILEELFVDTLSLASSIFGDRIYKPYVHKDGQWQWAPRASTAFYDAVMVSISRNINERGLLMERRERIIQETISLFQNNPIETFTGRGNSKADIQERIDIFDQMLKRTIQG